MFERFKFVFSHGKSTPPLPETVWALTILLNQDASKRMTTAEAIAYAKRHADELGERTYTLYLGGSDTEETVDLFSNQEKACVFLTNLWERHVGETGPQPTAFGMVQLRRESLFGALSGVKNLSRVTLDPGFEGERVLSMDEFEHVVRH